MSKGTGQVRNASTTQSSEPWSGQAPYLRGVYEAAGNLPQQQHYPGQSIASQSPETLEAYDLQSGRARAGSPLQTAGNQQIGATLGGGYFGGGAGQQQLESTLRGDYLHGGPGFDAAFDAAQRRITPAVQGAFEGVGRFGGGLGQVEETQALGDAFAGLYGQERARQMQATGLASADYTQERNRQLQAMGAVPTMANMDYQNIGALSEVGAQREGYQQALLGDQLNRWNFAQQAPYDQIMAQSGIIQGGFPGGQSALTQYGKPGLLDIAGADFRSSLSRPGGDLRNIWDRLGSYDNI